jgi:hypothetical protein
MQTESLISINDICANHEIEISFISSLQKTGLIEIIRIEETWFIDTDQLQLLEKYIRLYYELNINLEGIETINHLLNRIIAMNDEIISLRNSLRLYEENR